MSTEQLSLPLGALVEPEQGDVRLTIQERFDRFHTTNPWVLHSLESLTSDYIGSGNPRVGMKMLTEVLRWHYDRETTGAPFKLDNDFTSRYTRLIIERNPQWGFAFETRALRS